MRLSSLAFFAIIVCLIACNAAAACTDCRMTEPGIQLIRFYEGYSPVRYKDSAGLWTIGYGHLILPGEKFQQPMMPDAAEKLLHADISPKERDVNRLVIVSLRQPQFNALACFTYNVGAGSFAGSTLLRKVNAKDDFGAVEQFGRWTYAGGKWSRGLAARRASESKMFVEKDDE